MHVYLAGPMGNRPFFNHDAFMMAERTLRDRGWFVFNPVRHDMAMWGEDMVRDNPTGDHKRAEREHNFSLRKTLAADFDWLCKCAQAIVLLPGWETSKGAIAEYYTAQALGIRILYMTDDLNGVDEEETYGEAA